MTRALIFAIQWLFASLPSRRVTNPLVFLVSLFAVWTQKSWFKAAPAIGRLVQEKVTAVFFEGPRLWVPIVTSYLQELIGRRIPLEQIFDEEGRVAGRNLFERVGEVLMEPMLGLIAGVPDEEGELDGRAGAERFLALNFQFQMNAWLLRFLSEQLSLGSMKAMKDLPNAINWGYGLGWLSWLVLGPLFRVTVVDPFQRELNEVYLPARLTINQLLDGWNQGLVSDDLLVTEARRLGWSASRLNTILRLRERSFTLAQLTDFFEARLIDVTQLRELILEQGWTQEKADFLVSWVMENRRRKSLDRIARETGNRFIEGVAGEPELRETLARVGLTEEEIGLEIATLEIRRLDRAFLSRADLRRLRDKGLLRRTRWKEKMRDLRFQEEDIDLVEVLEFGRQVQAFGEEE